MLVQHEASFTRKSQPSAASSYQSGFCSQGIKRPAYTPPIRLRRRDALDQHNARLTRKTRPSAASSYQAVFMGRRPMPRQRGLFVKSPLWNPEKQRLTFIVWFFIVCSQGIKRPAYMSPAFDELYLLRTYPSYVF